MKHQTNKKSKQSYELSAYESNDENEQLNNQINKNIQTSIASELNNAHNHSHGHTEIAPVAWIIIVGESLHNFIDGLSIGCAFNESIVKGASLSLAIICEELPHKLGDFAILLAAGMSFKVALICNFFNSCFVYGGICLKEQYFLLKL